MIPAPGLIGATVLIFYVDEYGDDSMRTDPHAPEDAPRLERA